MTTKQLSDERPWGKWEILLDENYCKVKRITVKPHSRLSYQKHEKREELWTIVKGEGIVILKGEKVTVKPGNVVHIPTQAAHRMMNETDEAVIFIEIQRGSYFGEDDIIRLEDDYGRN
ncbi:phosphomannose isomerase type II C-terminal cupin domain [bacterium]|jgi:mannose-6-phosphate isomerase|nr:phosphomannose isomerase type II C-terminal cupin domain [bacterium]MBT3581511.1 phosphomannose isomerase type II C-terminal cupin domain [bacterium]MBT4551532.1 phosphomannose isomerase type II C-terminal cupin domain [bacterium]MBT5988500.1 phosphomannose isomerase type II C-terminal cupin domain [bacterium]MBT7088302.1 phosphomannose isomerase type II C-terminal cupin domain [bacterium]